MEEPLHYLSILDLSKLIKEKKISPVEITEHLLGRIDAIDIELKSYATVTADMAMDQAQIAEQQIMSGDYLGFLHGVPIALKDLCYTKGVRTMGGTAVLEDFKPAYDATIVERFRAAGAILL
jgi:amidase